MQKVIILIFIISTPFNVSRYTKLTIQDVENKLFTVIRSKSSTVQSRWSIRSIRLTAKAIVDLVVSTGKELDKVFAQIETESEFKYWAVSRLNTNGTRDYGLTQQNSDLYQHRCVREFGRRCYTYELLVPWISVRLMKRRYIECRRFVGDSFYVCYNSAKKAMRVLSDYKLRWDRSLVKIRNVIWKHRTMIPSCPRIQPKRSNSKQNKWTFRNLLATL